MFRVAKDAIQGISDLGRFDARLFTQVASHSLPVDLRAAQSITELVCLTTPLLSTPSSQSSLLGGSKVSAAQLARLPPSELFDAMDEDNSGALSLDEFAEVVKCYGQSSSDWAVTDQLGGDGAGVLEDVSRSQGLATMRAVHPPLPLAHIISQACCCQNTRRWHYLRRQTGTGRV